MMFRRDLLKSAGLAIASLFMSRKVNANAEPKTIGSVTHRLNEPIPAKASSLYGLIMTPGFPVEASFWDEFDAEIGYGIRRTRNSVQFGQFAPGTLLLWDYKTTKHRNEDGSLVLLGHAIFRCYKKRQETVSEFSAITRFGDKPEELRTRLIDADYAKILPGGEAIVMGDFTFAPHSEHYSGCPFE